MTGIFLREIRGTECRIQAFEKDMQTAKDSQSYIGAVATLARSFSDTVSGK